MTDVRPDLLGVAPYVSPQLPARYRMNTNESPYPPPDSVVEEITQAFRTVALNRYPDRDAGAVVESLAEYTGWPAEGLWIANGSNEVLLHLFLAFAGPGRTSLTFEPTYSLHTLIPKIAGTKTVSVRRAPDFDIDLDDAVAAIGVHDPDVVLVCSPNNPTGGTESLDVVRALAAETNGLVVVDEAYGEFAAPEESVRSLLDDHANVVLVKTFSKAWSLAGARLGYLLVDPAIVEGLLRVRLPYHLSTISQLIGSIVLRHASEVASHVAAVTEERDRIAVELQALGIKTYPSRANFVLFEVGDPDAVWQELVDRGVLVRNYSGQAGLERCLRVTAGLPEETEAFLKAMHEVLDE